MIDYKSFGITYKTNQTKLHKLYKEDVQRFREAINDNPYRVLSNVKHFPNGDFTEASHRDCDGDVGILEIMRAYHDCGYKGYVRPDHGRHIWGEQCRPGYGLYDRALGIMYLWGCWDMLERTEGKVDG